VDKRGERSVLAVKEIRRKTVIKCPSIRSHECRIFNNSNFSEPKNLEKLIAESSVFLKEKVFIFFIFSYMLFITRYLGDSIAGKGLDLEIIFIGFSLIIRGLYIIDTRHNLALL
jgi:hypothetical protein